MGNFDKRNRLEDEVFTYRISKNNTIFIDWYGKQVKIIKGKAAEKLLTKITQAENEKEIQLLLAKVTGNFKRGNEKSKSYYD
ncbi:hypothetical protein [Heyndrickxia oleronia]|uniref:Uncharacterized protein n=1 Tax=Heyndrickxia oleronia TaxID=38875 RepID=A0A8E2I4F7_9BACI|nr:hypothetical protein [Heyndrickxia oleronia]MEC1374296.1 hypothetical protein [Heyndrickxia oleronia]OOP66539.1 hypothetical protein BWZ43_20440 [Heyndrickxia oleronia]QQZ07116.1 hypothetical protein I5818_12325 [Heyndrickxia oleronia]